MKRTHLVTRSLVALCDEPGPVLTTWHVGAVDCRRCLGRIQAAVDQGDERWRELCRLAAVEAAAARVGLTPLWQAVPTGTNPDAEAMRNIVAAVIMWADKQAVRLAEPTRPVQVAS